MATLRASCVVAAVVLAVGCSKQNPALCCETDAECAVVGFDDRQPCEDGVCVLNECTDTGCDGPEDCPAPTGICLAGSCVQCASNGDCSGTLPFCEPTTHACVACTEDSQCSSGACDLMAGACVPESEALYVSPGGTGVGLCTMGSPCSLGRAFELLDQSHEFIVMAAGDYSVGGTVAGRAGFVVGHEATLNVTGVLSQIALTPDSDLSIRGLAFAQSPNAVYAIVCQGPASRVSLREIHADVSTLAVESRDCDVSVANSTFQALPGSPAAGVLLRSPAELVVDRSRFEVGAGVIAVGSNGTITNSVFISNGGEFGVSESSFRIAYNTFVSVRNVNCTTTSVPAPRTEWVGNIIIDAVNIGNDPGCNYSYNLVTPPDPGMGGIQNITGDPLFQDRSAGDLHLLPDSPAINAGDPSSPEDHDFDGAPRPQDGRADIGAFELQP